MCKDSKEELKQLMVDISEDGYHAGWMGDLEHHLWQAVLEGPKHYGQTYIDEETVEKLIPFSIH
jgi:hypothetical protein